MKLYSTKRSPGMSISFSSKNSRSGNKNVKITIPLWNDNYSEIGFFSFLNFQSPLRNTYMKCLPSPRGPSNPVNGSLIHKMSSWRHFIDMPFIATSGDLASRVKMGQGFHYVRGNIQKFTVILAKCYLMYISNIKNVKDDYKICYKKWRKGPKKRTVKNAETVTSKCKSGRSGTQVEVRAQRVKAEL